MILQYKKIRPGAIDPEYKTPGSVAFDIAAAVDFELESGQIALVPTGLVIEVPEGHALLLCSRSSTPQKLHLSPPHGLGIIDQDYCGDDDELMVQVMCHWPTLPASSYKMCYDRGTRIAQGLIVPVEKAVFHESSSSFAANRGGFGSTG